MDKKPKMNTGREAARWNSILGIPVASLTMEESVQQILDMVDSYQKDQKSRYVATVNVDFLCNSLGWRKSNISNSELLSFLRQADLVTADGQPILWLSCLLGIPLPERVSGADLLTRLVQEAAQNGLKLFFLGGGEGIPQEAARQLQLQEPSIKIVGAATPWVDIRGQGLADIKENDEAILQSINSSGADILFIGFGNPKQELWYHRVKDRLKVPVAIGVGGAFSFAAGRVKRAPKWVQKIGMEWFFRLLQDPVRLWKRYCVGIVKLGWMALPLLFHQWIKRGAESLFSFRGEKSGPTLTFIKGGEGSYSIGLPEKVEECTVRQMREKVEALTDVRELILNFHATRTCDIAALGGLVVFLQNISSYHSVHTVHISSRLQKELLYHRLGDFFKKYECPLHRELPLMWMWEEKDRYSALKITGDLQLAGKNPLLPLSPPLLKDCVVDLTECTSIDHVGVAYLLRLRKNCLQQGLSFQLKGVSKSCREVFKLAQASF